MDHHTVDRQDFLLPELEVDIMGEGIDSCKLMFGRVWTALALSGASSVEVLLTLFTQGCLVSHLPIPPSVYNIRRIFWLATMATKTNFDWPLLNF